MSASTMWDTDCLRCDAARSAAEEAAGDWGAAIMRRMIVCPTCGNKRCPKATWHENECTGSNDSGQPGSDYVKWVDDGRTPEQRLADFFGETDES